MKKVVLIILGVLSVIFGLLLLIGEAPIGGIVFVLIGAGLFFLAKKSTKKPAAVASMPQAVPQQVSTPESKPEPKPAGSKKENHRVAGVSYRPHEIESIGSANNYFETNKSEMIEDGIIDEKIWEYSFSPKNVELVPEPDNEHDPNAIKVVIDGVHVGYIKSGSCAHVKKLMQEDKIESITANIGGGRYKVVYEDYDDENDKEVYRFEAGETDSYSIELTFNVKE